MKVKHFYIRVSKEHLQQDEDTLNGFMATVRVIRTAQQLVTTGQTNFWSIVVYYSDSTSAKSDLSDATEKQPAFDPSTLSSEERIRYQALRIWRSDEASKDNFPHYFVASNAQLGAIAKMNPQSTEELRSLKGFGDRKITKYGDNIIALLNSV